MLDTQTLANLNDLRGRVLRGEEVGEDELRLALETLRTARATASQESTARKKASNATKSAAAADQHQANEKFSNLFSKIRGDAPQRDGS